MKSKLILLVVTMLFFLNCKNTTEEKLPDSSESKEIVHDELGPLKLDNNQKWTANSETHIGITKMDSIINAFKPNGSKSYTQLGELLSKQTSYVIKNCSMKGEPHDQLHIVLIPMLDEISILKESENESESKNALKQLEFLVEAYFKHFKL